MSSQFPVITDAFQGRHEVMAGPSQALAVVTGHHEAMADPSKPPADGKILSVVEQVLFSDTILIKQILPFLTIQEASTFGCVSKSHRILCNDASLWKRLLVRLKINSKSSDENDLQSPIEYGKSIKTHEISMNELVEIGRRFQEKTINQVKEGIDTKIKSLPIDWIRSGQTRDPFKVKKQVNELKKELSTSLKESTTVGTAEKILNICEIFTICEKLGKTNFQFLPAIFFHRQITGLESFLKALKEISSFSEGENKIFREYALRNRGEMDLSNCGLTFVPHFIRQVQLSLDLSENHLVCSSLTNFSNLTGLILCRSKLTHLPPAFSEGLENLKVLNLFDNKLTSIPDSIEYLKNLEELFLWKNQITSLSESIGKLTKLRRLGLSKNKLRSLPNSIGNLKNLRELLLPENQIIFLPESIGNLTNLQRLDLSSNKLESIPSSIGNLTKLPKLEIRDNKLKSLPDSIRKMPNLRVIEFNKNEFEGISILINSFPNNIHFVGENNCMCPEE